MVIGTITSLISGINSMDTSFFLGLLVMLLGIGSSVLIGSVCIMVGEISEDTEVALSYLGTLKKDIDDTWVCKCGSRNSNADEKCSKCGREKEAQ